MYRYRCEVGSTPRALNKLNKVDKLGTILKVQGYRFRSTRKIGDQVYNTTHERVMVYGRNGTARFDGFCWSYCGEGPHGLVELLLKVGVPKKWAEAVAFGAPRRNEVGTDWSIHLAA
jgi:hypothetical protein